jgi:hypothetical protein
VTFADRMAVRRLGCRPEERVPGVVVKASATGPLSPVPTTRRARRREDGDGGDGGGYLMRLVTPIAALTQLLRTAGAVGYLGRPGRLMENSELVAELGKLLWHCITLSRACKGRRLAQPFDAPPGCQMLSAPAAGDTGVQGSVNAALGTHPQSGRPDRARSSSGPGQRDAGR